jgi:tetratricopeptide (TPR) repeat protein
VRADREAEQARALSDFMRGVLTSVEPESRGADVRLIRVLATASETAAQRFGAHPAREAEVRDLLGQVYFRLSMWNEAKAEFARAAGAWEREAGPDDARTLEARLGVMRTALNLARAEEAEGVLRDLLPTLERVAGPDDPRTLEGRRGVALTHLLRGRADEAERLLLTLRAHPRLAQDDAAQIRLLGGLAAVETYRFSADDEGVRHGALVRAEGIAREWIERSTRLLGPDSMVTYQATVKWADIVSNLGRFEEAAAACRRLLDGSAQRLGECHTVRVNAMSILAEALARLGGEREPGEFFLRVVECARQQYSPDSPVYLGTVSDALRHLDRAGLSAQGEAMARQLAESLRRLGGGHDDMDITAELYVAHFASAQGRLEEAEALFGPLLARAGGIPDRRSRARVYLLHGRHLARRGLFDLAEQDLRHAAGCLNDIREGTWDSYPDDVIAAFIGLYEAWGKAEQAAEYRSLRESARRP